MRINGTIISYYFICKTKLWLHANRINLEDNSEDVRIGKVLHQINEDRVDEVSFESIKVDKITKDYIIEVKKSDSDLEASRWQLLLYLYKLKQIGVVKKGKLEVFEKRKQNKKVHIIELTKEKELELEEIIKDIKKLIDTPIPPKPIKKSICKKCAYFEYCFI